MKRRTFLATTAAAAAGTQLIGGVPLRAFSPMHMMDTMNEDDDRILIVIQMFGGNDGMNTIVPVEDPQYYNLRPSLAIPKDLAVKVLSKVYMHPALNPAGTYNLKSMFEDGRLAIVQGIGYENPNLSHFRSTDIWLSGFNSSDPNKRLIDGWLGRYWSTDFRQIFHRTRQRYRSAVLCRCCSRAPKAMLGSHLQTPRSSLS
jgi:uncharacterized protein (DUF1501 family)